MWRRRGGADPGATPPVPVNTPVEGVAAVAAPAPAAGARAEEALAALAADDEVEAAAPPPAEAEAGAGAGKGSSPLSRSFPKDPFAAASPAASLRDAKAAVHAAAVGDGGLGMQSLGETLSGTNRSKSIAEIESEQSAPQKAHAQHQARGFFVRIVAQRELAVSEDKWIEVLARHAQQGYERMAKASKALASGAAGGSLPDMSEEALIHQTRFRWPVLEVISPYTLFYMTWTYIMMAVDMTYTAFFVPYSVTFGLEDCSWNSSSAMVDFMFGWLYVVDMIINFRVGYSLEYKGSRVLELSGPRAAAYYMRHGTFPVDLLATIPVFAQTACLSATASSTGFGVNITQAMRLLRLLRLARAIRLIAGDALDVASSSIKGASASTVALVQVTQVLVIYGWTAHIMACIWIYTGIAEDTTWYYHGNAGADFEIDEWGPPNSLVTLNYERTWTCQYGLADEDDAPESWLKAFGLLCAGDGDIYMVAFYFATMTITTVGYGDISVTTTTERAVVTVFMVFGAAFFSYIVSTVTLVMEKLSKTAQEVAAFNDKMKVVEHWASERDLPKKLKKDIRAYYSMVWSSQKDNQEENEIMCELPYPLRCRAAININAAVKDLIPALAELEDYQWTKISSRMLPEWYGPGHFLCCPEGYGNGTDEVEDQDSFYVVEKGRIACLSAEDLTQQKVLDGPCILGVREVFELGMEPAALESQDEYSLMTVAPTWLWRIKKSTLRAVFALNPRLQNEFINGLLDNRDTLEEFVLNPEEEAALRGSGYGKAASSDDEPEVVRRGASRAAIEFGGGAIYGH